MSVLGTLSNLADDVAIAVSPLGPGGEALNLLSHGDLGKITGRDKHEPLSQLLRGGGFADSEIPTGIGVINAESGGVPNRHARNDGGPGFDSVGLGMINTKAHHEWLVSVVGKADQASIYKWLENPVNNIKAMKHVFDGQGWSGWTMYKNGKYKQYMKNDKSVLVDDRSVGEAITDVPGDVVSTATSGIEAVGKGVISIAENLGILFQASTYFRLLKGSGGALFIIIGTTTLVYYFAKTASGTSPMKAAASVVPSAKAIAKVVK